MPELTLQSQDHMEITMEMDKAKPAASQEPRTKRTIGPPQKLTNDTLEESSEEVICTTQWNNDRLTLTKHLKGGHLYSPLTHPGGPFVH